MKLYTGLKAFDLNSAGGRRKIRRLVVVGVIALLAVVVTAVRLLGLGSGPESVMTAVAERRPFVAMVVEQGTLKAAETITFTAPRIRRVGNVQILEMAEEGSVVQPGDLVVRFDSSALEERIRQKENEVERTEAQLRKTIAQQESQMATLQANYEQAQYSYQQARLSLERMQFEAEVRKRQEELSFKKSELSLQRAREAIDTQRAVNEAALQRIRLNLNRQRTELEDMRREMELMVLYAEHPGLVSYENTWGPNGQTKVKVGDSPYAGQAIISLPDLSRMVVEIPISELDIHKIAVGQEALVTLDAYPDRVFTAKVTEVSPLARRMGVSQMKVFDSRVMLDESDLSLRPGMTAQVSIITRYLPGALVVPNEAIFRRDGKPVVFVMNGGVEEVEVELGPENGNFVVIGSGIEPGVLVALRDPFQPLGSLETAGAEALREQRRAEGGGGEVEFRMGGDRMMRIFR